MVELDPAIIAGRPLFAGLEVGDLSDILRDARSSQIARGGAVFEQGEEPQRFFLLLNGHLQVVKLTSDGQQVVVRYVVPGEMFGVAVALGLSAYPASVVAAEDSVILTWPSAAWPRLVARCPRSAPMSFIWSGRNCRTRIAASSRWRPSRSSGASPMRCCGWPSKPGARSTAGWRSPFPSAGKTSRK